ncbi:MAG: 16S rRNA processing protein RimM [Polyangiaceae bacterium]|nr:16S rRNA processing protein RimM [Polyangiaceae bacterium]
MGGPKGAEQEGASPPVAPTGARVVELGRIAAAHGLRGELRLALHWSGSESIAPGARLWIGADASRREHRVESVRGSARGRLVKLRGVDDREAAEALRGAPVAVERDALPPLAAGEYYLADLPGLRVEGPAGLIGRVIEVRTHPTVDTAVIELGDGARVEQPLVEGLVEAVDLGAGVLRLASAGAWIE